MSDYKIAELAIGNGWLGIGPIPGRSGRYDADLNAILAWGATLVLTMTLSDELDYVGAASFGDDLEHAGVAWRHLPIDDMNAPRGETARLWPAAAQHARDVLGQGGRVFTHCFGGCGRAGMASLRLMVEAGEDPSVALVRLRQARPCAIETEAQFAWAAAGTPV